MGILMSDEHLAAMRDFQGLFERGPDLHGHTNRDELIAKGFVDGGRPWGEWLSSLERGLHGWNKHLVAYRESLTRNLETIKHHYNSLPEHVGAFFNRIVGLVGLTDEQRAWFQRAILFLMEKCPDAMQKLTRRGWYKAALEKRTTRCAVVVNPPLYWFLAYPLEQRPRTCQLYIDTTDNWASLWLMLPADPRVAAYIVCFPETLIYHELVHFVNFITGRSFFMPGEYWSPAEPTEAERAAALELGVKLRPFKATGSAVMEDNWRRYKESRMGRDHATSYEEYRTITGQSDLENWDDLVNAGKGGLSENLCRRGLGLPLRRGHRGCTLELFAGALLQR